MAVRREAETNHARRDRRTERLARCPRSPGTTQAAPPRPQLRQGRGRARAWHAAAGGKQSSKLCSRPATRGARPVAVNFAAISAHEEFEATRYGTRVPRSRATRRPRPRSGTVSCDSAAIRATTTSNAERSACSTTGRCSAMTSQGSACSPPLPSLPSRGRSAGAQSRGWRRVRCPPAHRRNRRSPNENHSKGEGRCPSTPLGP